jgi:RecB family exonuclease
MDAVIRYPLTQPFPGRPAPLAPAIPSYRSLDKLDLHDLKTLLQRAAQVVKDKRSQLGLLDEADAQRVTAATSGTASAVFDAPREAQAANAELATILSPSQVNCWQRCQAQWYFRYFLRTPDETKTSGLAIGRAVHTTMQRYFAQVICGGARFTEDQAQGEYRQAWSAEADSTNFDSDETPESAEACGSGLVKLLVRDWAPKVIPAAVEQKVTGTIGGVQVQGYIDLLDVNGKIIDLKTAAKSPSSKGGVKPDYAFQVATYAAIGAATGAEVVTAVKNKTPKLVEQTVEVDSKMRAMTGRLYPLAQEQMRAGYYFPNRQNMMCSRKNCGYWRECEDEFGGRVPGGEEEGC